MHHTPPSRFSRLFTAIAVIVLTTIICLALAEGGAGLALKRIRAARPLYMLSYSDDEITRLYGSADVQRYREVIAESWKMGDTVYSPFVEFRMAPTQGKWFNVTEEGFRSNGHGAQDLGRAGPKIFVFGGSTTMGSGVTDAETIPAYLEDSLRSAGKPDAQVFNFGAVAWFSTQERIALERLLTAGIKPDLAVFVDGLNDFYYCTVPDQSSWYERLMQTTRARSRQPLGIELAARSNVVQLARHFGGDKAVVVREWGSFCNSDADIDRIVRRLDTNRRIIDGMAERLGFKVLFVTQPVPTWHYDNAKRPVPVKEEMLGYHANSARGYARMAEMGAAGQLWQRNHLWLGELEPDDSNAYIDTVHYSPAFNRAIADAIAHRVADDRLVP